MTRQLTLRLSDKLAEKLELAAARLSRKRSEVVRLALEKSSETKNSHHPPPRLPRKPPMCYNEIPEGRGLLRIAMLRVQLLGGFQVERDGVALTAFHSKKAQSLLAYLMIHRDRAHPRSVLANLFWGESDEARAQANLRNALYSLRCLLEGPHKRFGNYILTEGSAVRFNPKSEFSLDVSEFEEGLEQAQRTSGAKHAALLHNAVARYRGELLPGFYDDWVLIEQEHLKELYEHSLKELAAHYAEENEYAQAIEWARRALAVTPFQEDLHRALMQLYALAGDRTAALQQYTVCEAILREQLKTEPLPETQALYHKLVHGQPLEPPSVQEPLLEAPFVGRERELHTLHTLWAKAQQGQGQTIFISGEIGAGKTTLIQRFIEDLTPTPSLKGRGSPPRVGEGLGERSYVLQGTAHASSSELPYQPVLEAVRAGVKLLSPSALATLPVPWRSELAQFVPEMQGRFSDLKPNPQLPPAQGKARWFAALTGFFELCARERPAILFLDDLHWADDATLEYLGYLTAHLKDHTILVVGAYRAEEALEGSRLRAWLDKLGPGRSYHALALVRLSRAETELWLQNSLGCHEQPILQILYDKTEGNPLFLTELTRSLLRSGLLRCDEHGCYSLTASEIGAAHWSENLRELIGASLRRAPSRAQSLLGSLAVIGAGATSRSPLQVLQELLHQPQERILNRLDELRTVGLLVERDGRYQFYHELIRQVVYENLSAERKKLWHRQVAQALEKLYPDHLDELSGELTRHWERAAAPLKALLYAERAGKHAWHMYAYGTALQFYDRALKFVSLLAIPNRPETLVRLHCRRAEAFDRLGQRREQEAALQSAACWAAQADERTTLRVRNLWVDFYIATGCYSQALTEAQAMLAGAHGDRELEAQAYQQIGLAYLNQGHYQKAIEHFGVAAQLCQEIGRLDHLGLTLTNMGVAYGYLGEHSRTLELYQRAYEIARQTDDRLGQGRALTNLGIVYKKLRNLQEASQCSEQAFRIWQQIGDRRAESHTLINLGNLYRTLGELDKAQEYLERACELSREIKNLQGLAIALHNLGNLYGEQRHQYAAALHYENEALAVAEQLGLKSLVVHILSNNAIFCARLGRQSEALEHSEQAIHFLHESPGTPDPHLIYWNHYELLQSLSQTDPAQVRAALATAHEMLWQQAQTITDSAQRQAFLATPENRQILQAWQAVSAPHQQ